MSYLDHDYKNFPELTNSQLGVMQFSSPHVQITEDFDAFVVKVHDGDTITVSTNFRDFVFPIRLLDIDAPELSEGGREAGDYLRSLVLNKLVRVLINPDNRVGKYGRLLGKVVFGGLDVGEEMMHLQLVKPFGLKKESQVPVLGKILREAEV